MTCRTGGLRNIWTKCNGFRVFVGSELAVGGGVGEVVSSVEVDVFMNGR